MIKPSFLSRQGIAGRFTIGALALGSALLSIGCGGYARSPEQYADDTFKVLERQNEPIRVCYNKTLKSNPNLNGNVTVSFIVDNKTGRIRKARIDNTRTTAPEPVRKCVLDVLHDLKVTPADQNEGHAVFTWEFKQTFVKEDGTPLETQPPPS